MLELVQLPDGQIALRRSDDEGGEPLVVIQFSEESQVYLMDSTLEVARAMVQAGIQAAAQVAERREAEMAGKSPGGEGGPRIVH